MAVVLSLDIEADFICNGSDSGREEERNGFRLRHSSEGGGTRWENARRDREKSPHVEMKSSSSRSIIVYMRNYTSLALYCIKL